MEGLLEALVSLFIVLVAAGLGGWLFNRIGQPVVIGQILGGMLIGPSVFGIVHHNFTLELFSELGAIFLLFLVGLETKVDEIAKVGKAALLVGVLGVVLPFVAGYGLMAFLGYPGLESLFIGTALVATSVGITSKVLRDLGLLDRRFAKVILGAAVIDDILGMVILAVVSGLGASGEVDLVQVGIIVVEALLFVGWFTFGMPKVIRRLIHRRGEPKFDRSPLLPVVIFGIGLSALSAYIGLAAIIGAFLAGLAVSELSDYYHIETEVEPIYAFLTPFFFAFIGIQANLREFSDPSVIALTVGIIALAIVTKFVGAFIGSLELGKTDASLVGVGMVPRGEVGIIVASIGLSAGIVEQSLFLAVVGMSIVTTLIVPPILPMLVKKLPAESSAAAREAGPQT